MFPLMRGNADPSFAAHSSGFWMAFTAASGPVKARSGATQTRPSAPAASHRYDPFGHQ